MKLVFERVHGIKRLIQPTVPHLTSVLATLQHEPARMIVRSSHNSAYAAERLAERRRLPVVVLPSTVGGNDDAKDLFSLFDDIISRLFAAAK